MPFSFFAHPSGLRLLLSQNMKTLLSLLLLSPCVLPSYSQTPEKFFGKIIGLQPDGFHMYQRVLSAEPALLSTLKFAPANPPKATIAFGRITDARSAGDLVTVLVEPPTGVPYIAFDFNADGTIAVDERFAFMETPASKESLYTIVLLPIKHPLFKGVPMHVRYFRGLKHPKLTASDRLIDQTVWAHAIAEVDISGRKVRFQYPFGASNPTISTTEGLFGIDADSDGAIGNEQFSLETSYANEVEVVFRFGDIYLSTESIDSVKNVVTVRRRPKSEYLREELAVGKQMPDFSFVDFAGKKRSLSEFRGKYLLIEWWGVWCIDCVRDMPFTVKAYERFRSRGFEILGLNWDDKTEDAAAFLVKSAATWPHARKDSIKELTETTYRIQEYPALVLLDPNGKVLSLKQKALQGPELLETLERLLPQ